MTTITFSVVSGVLMNTLSLVKCNFGVVQDDGLSTVKSIERCVPGSSKFEAQALAWRSLLENVRWNSLI